MKIRHGFVSNSSSSSFCILGVILPDHCDNIEDGDCDPKRNLIQNFLDNRKDPEDCDLLNYVLDTIHEEKCRLIVNLGISEYSNEDMIVGMNAYCMENDETLLEFKERVCRYLNACFNLVDTFKPSDINWYIDGGYT